MRKITKKAKFITALKQFNGYVTTNDLAEKVAELYPELVSKKKTQMKKWTWGDPSRERDAVKQLAADVTAYINNYSFDNEGIDIVYTNQGRVLMRWEG